MSPKANLSVAFTPHLARNLCAQGWDVDLLDEVPSTNALAVSQPRPWGLVAAHDQSSGRGRMDRSWQVPPGAAVTMSMTLPLPQETSSWGWIPLFVGQAVREALADVTGAHRVFGLKWPNDVLAREADGAWRKVGGILCQTVRADAGASLVVAGVGLNVTQGRDDLPVENATSLRLTGHEVTRDAVIERVAAHTMTAARRWSGDETQVRAMRDEVRANCLTIGATIDVHTPDGGVTRCRGVGIDDVGRIVTVPADHGDDSPHRMAYSVADVVHARLRANVDPMGEQR